MSEKVPQKNGNLQTGFTMVELVVVLVILGVLSSVGLSKFSSTSSFHQRGFTEETLSAIRFAQRLASTSGCHVQVQINNTALQINRWTDCRPSDHSSSTTPIRHPKNTGDYINPAPNGMTITTTNIYFDGNGKPYNTSTEAALSNTTNLSIGSWLIKLEPETGFAYL